MSRQSTQEKKMRIKRKVRALVSGTVQRPRLSVFRSNNFMYAQLIDDVNAKTLVSASDITASKKATKMEGAMQAGRDIAKMAIEKGINAVVFDRNGFKYAGRVKALADAARDAGLKF